MIIRQLSERYNVSEIPVREALKRLESEGYISHSANKSVIVCPLDSETLTNIFQIKGVLEGYATRTSIDYLTDSDIDDLQKINDDIAQAFINHQNDKYSELNIKFHTKIYEKNPNQEMVKLIMSLWKKWSMTKRVFNISPGRIEHSIGEHNLILELIRTKQYEKVELAVRDHKFNAGNEMVEKLLNP